MPYTSIKLFLQVEDDRVLLYLCKADKSSWYPELESGLETAEEEEKKEEGQWLPETVVTVDLVFYRTIVQ